MELRPFERERRGNRLPWRSPPGHVKRRAYYVLDQIITNKSNRMKVTVPENKGFNEVSSGMDREKAPRSPRDRKDGRKEKVGLIDELIRARQRIAEIAQDKAGASHPSRPGNTVSRQRTAVRGRHGHRERRRRPLRERKAPGNFRLRAERTR